MENANHLLPWVCQRDLQAISKQGACLFRGEQETSMALPALLPTPLLHPYSAQSHSPVSRPLPKPHYSVPSASTRSPSWKKPCFIPGTKAFSSCWCLAGARMSAGLPISQKVPQPSIPLFTGHSKAVDVECLAAAQLWISSNLNGVGCRGHVFWAM